MFQIKLIIWISVFFISDLRADEPLKWHQCRNYNWLLDLTPDSDMDKWTLQNSSSLHGPEVVVKRVGELSNHTCISSGTIGSSKNKSKPQMLSWSSIWTAIDLEQRKLVLEISEALLERCCWIRCEQNTRYNWLNNIWPLKENFSCFRTKQFSEYDGKVLSQ